MGSKRTTASGSELWTTGFDPIDELVGGLRAGDNVVWITGKKASVDPFLSAFVRGVGGERPLAYFSFRRPAAEIMKAIPDAWSEQSLLIDCYRSQPSKAVPKQKGRIRNADAGDSARFARDLEQIEEQLGPGAAYVFDDLTTMARRWGDDGALALFLTACPRLYQLRTVAYWSLDRSRAEGSFIAQVTATTQVALDLTQAGDAYTVTVSKADGRAPRVQGRGIEFTVQRGQIRVLQEIERPKERLGEIVRHHRTTLGLSQGEVAKRIGVTPSALSQVERGIHGLSAETLLRLWDVLGLPFGLERDARPPPYVVFRRTSRHRTQPSPGIEIEALTERPGGFGAHVVVLAPRSEGSRLPFSTKRAEFIFVLTGVVELKIGNSIETLHQGDALMLTDSAVESWRNPSPAETRVCWILVPHGAK
ncbi:MAG: helix-turn-helix domain-containing protein [Actinomycetota bacterium]